MRPPSPEHPSSIPGEQRSCWCFILYFILDAIGSFLLSFSSNSFQLIYLFSVSSLKRDTTTTTNCYPSCVMDLLHVPRILWGQPLIVISLDPSQSTLFSFLFHTHTHTHTHSLSLSLQSHIPRSFLGFGICPSLPGYIYSSSLSILVLFINYQIRIFVLTLLLPPPHTAHHGSRRRTPQCPRWLSLDLDLWPLSSLPWYLWDPSAHHVRLELQPDQTCHSRPSSSRHGVFQPILVRLLQCVHLVCSEHLVRPGRWAAGPIVAADLSHALPALLAASQLCHQLPASLLCSHPRWGRLPAGSDRLGLSERLWQPS